MLFAGEYLERKERCAMKICVVGLGYIGLPTALMLAAHGADVVGVDYNAQLIQTLQKGELTFEEKGLGELFAQALSGGIVFSETYEKADIYIVAVATPYDRQTKKIDPSYVISAMKSVLAVCPKGATVVVESTVSPGTIDHEVRPLLQAAGLRIGEDIHLIHAPERIIPGNMIHELRYNSRTMGADDAAIGEKIKEMYSSFCQGQIVITDIRTAEMTKVVENTYRDINIAFANELAKICRSDDMDVYEIIRIANLHPRVNILQPGPGVGGHCISVDPWFLVGDYPCEAKLIRSAREINDSMPAFVLGRIREIMKERGIAAYSRVGLYGLTYKENVDDTRESPALQLLELMKSKGMQEVQTYDPFVKGKLSAGQHFWLQSFLDACDLVVVLVGHEELLSNLQALQGKAILDTRHISGLEAAYTL